MMSIGALQATNRLQERTADHCGAVRMIAALLCHALGNDPGLNNFATLSSQNLPYKAKQRITLQSVMRCFY
jgi:hypothetical protein